MIRASDGAFAREPVEVRRRDFGAGIVATDIAVSNIIGQDLDQIGPGGRLDDERDDDGKHGENRMKIGFILKSAVFLLSVIMERDIIHEPAGQEGSSPAYDCWEARRRLPFF